MGLVTKVSVLERVNCTVYCAKTDGQMPHPFPTVGNKTSIHGMPCLCCPNQFAISTHYSENGIKYVEVLPLNNSLGKELIYYDPNLICQAFDMKGYHFSPLVQISKEKRL